MARVDAPVARRARRRGVADKVREREREKGTGCRKGKKTEHGARRASRLESDGERAADEDGARQPHARGMGVSSGLLPLAVARHPRAPHPCSVRRCPSPAPPRLSYRADTRAWRCRAFSLPRRSPDVVKCRRYRSPFVVPYAVRLADDSARALPCAAPFLQERERRGRIVSARGGRRERERVREGGRDVCARVPQFWCGHMWTSNGVAPRGSSATLAPGHSLRAGVVSLRVSR